MCPRQAFACARVRAQVVMIFRPLPSAVGVWIPPSGAASARGAWKGPGLAGDSWPRWVLPISRVGLQVRCVSQGSGVVPTQGTSEAL